MDEKEREISLLTFITWPKGLTQKPEELVAAGLNYSGKGDVCRCNYCGSTLRLWDAHESPLVKHARVRPNCSFLAKLDMQSLLKENNFGTIEDSHQQSSSSSASGNESLGAIGMDGSIVKFICERTVSKAEEEESEVPFDVLCKVCFDKSIEVVYLPCAHAFACRECAFQLQQCAVCNCTAISFVPIHFECA